jgi:hypothetical protein
MRRRKTSKTMQPTHESCTPSWCDNSPCFHRPVFLTDIGNGCQWTFVQAQRMLRLLAQAPRMLRRLKHSVASLSKELPPKVPAITTFQFSHTSGMHVLAELDFQSL